MLYSRYANVDAVAFRFRVIGGDRRPVVPRRRGGGEPGPPRHDRGFDRRAPTRGYPGIRLDHSQSLTPQCNFPFQGSRLLRSLPIQAVDRRLPAIVFDPRLVLHTRPAILGPPQGVPSRLGAAAARASSDRWTATRQRMRARRPEGDDRRSSSRSAFAADAAACAASTRRPASARSRLRSGRGGRIRTRASAASLAFSRPLICAVQ